MEIDEGVPSDQTLQVSSPSPFADAQICGIDCGKLMLAIAIVSE
jgi:hypothetical protein